MILALAPLSDSISLATSRYFFSSVILSNSIFVCSNSSCNLIRLCSISLSSSSLPSNSNISLCSESENLLSSFKEDSTLDIDILLSYSFSDIPLNSVILPSTFASSSTKSFIPWFSVTTLFRSLFIFSSLNVSSIFWVQVGQLSFCSKNSKFFLWVSKFCSIFVSSFSNCFNFVSYCGLSDTLVSNSLYSSSNLSVFLKYDSVASLFSCSFTFLISMSPVLLFFKSLKCFVCNSCLDSIRSHWCLASIICLPKSVCWFLVSISMCVNTLMSSISSTTSRLCLGRICINGW